MTNTCIRFQWSLCRRHPNQSPSGLQRVFSKRLRLLVGNCKHWKRNSSGGFWSFLWSVHVLAHFIKFTQISQSWTSDCFSHTIRRISQFILILNFRGFEKWSKLRHCILHLWLCPDPYHVSLGVLEVVLKIEG